MGSTQSTWGASILESCHFERVFSIMAARRVTSTAVDWVKFADKIPAAQQTAFAAFKNKHSEYLKAVSALPEAAPKIDFAAYANKIAVSGLVEEFQKKYESLEIPYPKESLTATFDQLGAQKKVEYEKFVAASKANIEAHKVDMAKWEAMLPVEQMTCEESTYYIPDHPFVLETIGNPYNSNIRPMDIEYTPHPFQCYEMRSSVQEVLAFESIVREYHDWQFGEGEDHGKDLTG